MSFKSKSDPLPREDGKCARRSCAKQVKITRRKDVQYEQYLREPFCSTDCARAWHGVVRPEPGKRGRVRACATGS